MYGETFICICVPQLSYDLNIQTAKMDWFGEFWLAVASGNGVTRGNSVAKHLLHATEFVTIHYYAVTCSIQTSLCRASKVTDATELQWKLQMVTEKTCTYHYNNTMSLWYHNTAAYRYLCFKYNHQVFGRSHSTDHNCPCYNQYTV